MSRETRAEVQEPWTVQKLIHWTTQHFTSKQIESARLDSELLLAHALKCRRLDLYMNFEKPLKLEELKSFKELVKRRALREPIAYLTGVQEFYGRSFKVGAGVLIPRPETEQLVGEGVEFIKSLKTEIPNVGPLSVLDVGTGSGCIGLTLLLEAAKLLKPCKLTCVDISPQALEIAASNAAAFAMTEKDVSFINQDFTDFSANCRELFDLVVANPPYVGQNTAPVLSADVVSHEPHQALFGGAQGFELTSQWIAPMTGLLKPGGLLIFEIGFDQGEIFSEILNGQPSLECIQIKKDYSGHNRVARAVKKA